MPTAYFLFHDTVGSRRSLEARRAMALRKIAYLTPLYFDERSCLGGGERYPLNLARGVVESSRGAYSVELVSYGDAPRCQVLCPGVTLRVLRASNRPRERLDVVSWELPEAIAQADLVHVHAAFTRASEMGILIAKQQRKPICITDHGALTSILGLSLGSLDLADRIICYSDFGASLYHGSLYDTQTPIVVIKGGVDADFFAPPTERPSRDRVLYVGRLLPHKGIDQLITALPPDLPLTICGQAYHDEYFRHLQSLATGKPVEFVTDADDVAIRALYARAWVTVLPSVYRDCYGHVYQAPELMGFTLLESMSCATPAIASRVGAMPEFILEGETGFIYDHLDELASRLRFLADNSSVVEQLGLQARHAVERDYDLKVAGAKMGEVYDGLIAQAREAAA